MHILCRNNYIDGIAFKSVLLAAFFLMLLAGCGKKDAQKDEVLEQETEFEEAARDEDAADTHVNFEKLRSVNEDIFAWLYVPGTNIDYPVCQSSLGDDSYYITHNVFKEEDPNGAIYTECANLKDMCDFNEILHGSSPQDGTMFADLQKFLDKKYFEDHEYIYVYTDGNALTYYIFAAYSREDNRLIAEYDFTYAKGCQDFLDEIFEGRSMNKLIRSGWENSVVPENFIITLSTKNSDDKSKQTVVIGCLVGDAKGVIDRYVDYSDPWDE